MNLKMLASMVAATSILTGCAVTMIAGGSMDNDIVVTFDNNEIPPAIRATLLKSRTLGVVSNDRASIKAADMFETQGGYTVKIDRIAGKQGEMTGSERRDALMKICRTQRPDAALMGRIVKTETGSVVATAFTGRAKINQKWIMEVLTCGTSEVASFGGDLNLNVGVYKDSNVELEDAIGAELGSKILAGLGKSATNTSGAGLIAAPAVSVPKVADSQSSAIAQTRIKSGEDNKSLSVREVQQRLLTLGYPVGVVDGIAGNRTVSAIKKFQLDNQLASTGVVDKITNDLLIEKSAN